MGLFVLEDTSPGGAPSTKAETAATLADDIGRVIRCTFDYGVRRGDKLWLQSKLGKAEVNIIVDTVSLSDM